MGTRCLWSLCTWLLVGLLCGVLSPAGISGAPLSAGDLPDTLRLPDAASSGLNGGKVRHFASRPGGLGASSSVFGRSSALAGAGPSASARSSLGAASDSPMRGGAALSSGGLGSSLASGSGRRRLGSSSLGGGGSSSSSSGRTVLGGGSGGLSRPSRHAHRHGHSGTRGQRVVRMECQHMRRAQLTSLLGPAFNARYMSVEQPPEFRPPTAGFGLSPLPTTGRRRAPTSRKKWTSRGGLMGDQPAEEDADGEEETLGLAAGLVGLGSDGKASLGAGRLYVDHPLSDDELLEDISETRTDADAAGLLSLGEVRGTPVLTSRLPDPRPATRRTSNKKNKNKKSTLDAGLLGDEAVKEPVILVGLDALTGLPEFAVGPAYRRDLPEEARPSTVDDDMERALEEASVSGLLVYLRNRFNATKGSLNSTLTAATGSRESLGRVGNRRKKRHSADAEPAQSLPGSMANGDYAQDSLPVVFDSLPVFADDDKMASDSLPVIDEEEETPTTKSRPRRAALGGGKASLSGPGATEPWQCASEVVWEDLGEDHFPRYIRRTRCLQRGCYNSFYECREKSFTIKVLRRASDRCVPVYGVTVSTAGVGGVPTVRKSAVLRYEQEWVFEERALPFCCECAPRFL